jgi:hypothetical protein
VDAALLILERIGLSPDDLTAAARQRPSVPTFAGTRLPDAVSGLALLSSLSLLVLATAEGPEWGWGDGRTIGLSAAATIALLLYFTGISVFPLGGAGFVQDVWHFSALQAGAGIAPATLELKELDEFPPTRAVEHDSPTLSFRPVIHRTG